MRKPVDPSKHMPIPKEFSNENRVTTLHGWETITVNHLIGEAEELKKQVNATVDEKINGDIILDWERRRIVCPVIKRNPDYIQQMAAYNKAIEDYNDQVIAFTNWQLSIKTKDMQDKDVQIERLERRLANLKAVRDGNPLPFPDQ